MARVWWDRAVSGSQVIQGLVGMVEFGYILSLMEGFNKGVTENWHLKLNISTTQSDLPPNLPLSYLNLQRLHLLGSSGQNPAGIFESSRSHPITLSVSMGSPGGCHIVLHSTSHHLKYHVFSHWLLVRGSVLEHL